MTREELYARMFNRIEAMKLHAQKKGDGVQADKMRKMELDLRKLFKHDETDIRKDMV